MAHTGLKVDCFSVDPLFGLCYHSSERLLHEGVLQIQ